MIPFDEFLPVPVPSRTKVKFNIRDGARGIPAWDLLLQEDQEPWLNMTRYRAERNSNNNLDGADYVLAFAQYPLYGPNFFVFGGLFATEPVVPKIDRGPGYRLTPLPLYSEYIRRLIVKLEVPLGQSYLRWYETLQGSVVKPVIYELAPDTKLGAFPGYQSVLLRHDEMQRIIANAEPSWRNALSNVKAVYVITDTSDGRLYVGSASGEGGGLWQRWASYANVRQLTGGNVKLEAVLAERGPEHIVKHFQYSILEIFDKKTRDDTILQREEFWKKALDTRRNGLNAN
jgi:hypothetical protein